MIWVQVVWVHCVIQGQNRAGDQLWRCHEMMTTIYIYKLKECVHYSAKARINERMKEWNSHFSKNSWMKVNVNEKKIVILINEWRYKRVWEARNVWGCVRVHQWRNKQKKSEWLELKHQGWRTHQSRHSFIKDWKLEASHTNNVPEQPSICCRANVKDSKINIWSSIEQELKKKANNRVDEGHEIDGQRIQVVPIIFFRFLLELPANGGQEEYIDP